MIYQMKIWQFLQIVVANHRRDTEGFEGDGSGQKVAAGKILMYA